MCQNLEKTTKPNRNWLIILNMSKGEKMPGYSLTISMQKWTGKKVLRYSLAIIVPLVEKKETWLEYFLFYTIS